MQRAYPCIKSNHPRSFLKFYVLLNSSLINSRWEGKKIIVLNTLFWSRMRKLRPHLFSYWSSLQLRPRNIGNINVCESSSAKGNASAGSLRIIGKYLWMCCDYGSTKNSPWSGDRISEKLSVPADVSTVLFLFWCFWGGFVLLNRVALALKVWLF